MDEPLAELSAYFCNKSRVPDPELVRLTAAARAGGSRWDGIPADGTGTLPVASQDRAVMYKIADHR